MENAKEVLIDVSINGRAIRGTVLTDGYDVDLSSLELSNEELNADVAYVYCSDNLHFSRDVEHFLRREVYYTVASTWEEGSFNEKWNDYVRCNICGLVFLEDNMVRLYDDNVVYYKFAFEYEGEYYPKIDGEQVTVRTDCGRDDTWIPTSVLENDYYWCEHCNSYVYGDDYYSDGCCVFCHEEEKERVIENYTVSHEHNENPRFFGEYDRNFVGLGFELEVDAKEERDDNNEVARNLISTCGLEKHEVRYAYDGSLRYGFECISEPHTVKEFWSKAPQWSKMLKYLSRNGYTSHDAGTCGLHVHVSREMFGKSEAEQTSAIAKVMVFFDENWNDIVKISRRHDFSYCEKNTCIKDGSGNYYCWKKSASRQRGHYVALNNANKHTFEYRLGRGTLNAWSFFSWIDFILTITKNSKRLTVNKVQSNDRLSWLAGIKESTAKYIYKRGAFRSEMLELYPSLEWEGDMTDCGNDD